MAAKAANFRLVVDLDRDAVCCFGKLYYSW